MRSWVVACALALTTACAAPQGTVGAVLAQQSDGRLLVHEAPKGLAAEKAGLAPGDEILLIDGMDVRRLDDKALHRALSGEVGSSVKLTVLRGEEVLRVTLKRTAARKRLLPASRR
ncbi:MAG: PDZ domain-containing protein [Polyangiaceae bacterium]|nr:PDZ domain-containing protein [Polyangiaceae bacterium]